MQKNYRPTKLTVGFFGIMYPLTSALLLSAIYRGPHTIPDFVYYIVIFAGMPLASFLAFWECLRFVNSKSDKELENEKRVSKLKTPKIIPLRWYLIWGYLLSLVLIHAISPWEAVKHFIGYLAAVSAFVAGFYLFYDCFRILAGKDEE